MKHRSEPRRHRDEPQVRSSFEHSFPDSNLAFLQALADALRDILRDERSHAS